MLTRLRNNLVEANYGALGLEVIVVIVGILIAFQIDHWAQEQRESQQEHQYILRLKKDLQSEIAVMMYSMQTADQRIAHIQLLERVLSDKQIAIKRPNDLAWALERATWRSFPQISAYVYTELLSTGNLSLIRSDDLRQGLAEYYSSIRHEAAIGRDLEIQNLFTRLTAGILSTAELFDIQENSLEQRTIEISPERALEIATDFSGRQGAAYLLPSLAQHHAFTKFVVKQSCDSAQRLVGKLDSLIENAD